MSRMVVATTRESQPMMTLLQVLAQAAGWLLVGLEVLLVLVLVLGAWVLGLLALELVAELRRAANPPPASEPRSKPRWTF
jgi:hypothetical protein